MMILTGKKLLLIALAATLLALPVTALADSSTTYGYDSLDRLKWVKYGNGSGIGYDYDKIGNLIHKQYVAAGTQLTINATASGCGAITPSGTILKNLGDNQTITFQAVQGVYPDVLVDGASIWVSLSSNPFYTFSDITSNHSLTGRFIVPDGDINGDGIVSVTDVLLALRIASGLVPLTPTALAHGDVYPLVNGRPAPDGKIDNNDAQQILNKIAGKVNWDTSCPTP